MSFFWFFFSNQQRRLVKSSISVESEATLLNVTELEWHFTLMWRIWWTRKTHQHQSSIAFVHSVTVKPVVGFVLCVGCSTFTRSINRREREKYWNIKNWCYPMREITSLWKFLSGDELESDNALLITSKKKRWLFMTKSGGGVALQWKWNIKNISRNSAMCVQQKSRQSSTRGRRDTHHVAFSDETRMVMWLISESVSPLNQQKKSAFSVFNNKLSCRRAETDPKMSNRDDFLWFYSIFICARELHNNTKAIFHIFYRRFFSSLTLS